MNNKPLLPDGNEAETADLTGVTLYVRYQVCLRQPLYLSTTRGRRRRVTVATLVFFRNRDGVLCYKSPDSGRGYRLWFKAHIICVIRLPT